MCTGGVSVLIAPADSAPLTCCRVTESLFKSGFVQSACLGCRLAAVGKACSKSRVLSQALWQASLHLYGPRKQQLASKDQALVPETV